MIRGASNHFPNHHSSPNQPNRTIDYYHKQKIGEFNAELDRINKLIQNETNPIQMNQWIDEKNKCIKQQNDYYLKTMDLLTAYYEHSINTAPSFPSPINKVQTNYAPNTLSNSTTNHSNSTTNHSNSTTNDSNSTTNDSNTLSNSTTNHSNYAPITGNLTTFLNKTTTVDKIHLFNEYMYRLNNETKYKKLNYLQPDSNKYCKYCGGKQIVDTLKSAYVCEQCGNCSFVLLEPEKTTYIKHPVIETQTFSYRRYDHFVEWLNKFHNVEKSKVPKKIYTLINKELNKLQRNNNDSEPIHKSKNIIITKETIIEILKKTGNSKYNCQVLQILNILNKKKLPTLPVNVQQTMKRMFKETLQLFSEICPNTRTNFLSYSYVIRKFLEILNERQYIEYFPLLKSKEKLYQQDLIWKTICNKLKWKYYPTI